MSDEQFRNDPARLPQNVTGWIELNDELRDSFEFQHGSVWLMAVPVCDRHNQKLWDYELSVITVDCDGPLQLECLYSRIDGNLLAEGIFNVCREIGEARKRGAEHLDAEGGA